MGTRALDVVRPRTQDVADKKMMAAKATSLRYIADPM